MNTQETPVHNHFWNKDFGSLVIANLLLTTAVYMMIPVVVGWLTQTSLPPSQKGFVLGAYGVGLFVLGPFCSYFVERYRRNHVCESSILLMAACMWVFGVLQENSSANHVEAFPLMALRAAVGALFGLAQMVLCSTLVIDVCESYQRTHANHAAAWFGRLSLALGPLMVVVFQQFLPSIPIYWIMAGMCVVAAVLIQLVQIPFRAPSDNYPSFSLDRFVLPASWPLFLVLMAFTTVVGMIIVQPHDVLYYVLMLAGFFIARLVQRFLEDDATIRSTIAVSFVIMMGALSFAYHPSSFTQHISPLLFGFATGVLGNNLLSCFLNISLHCQRGTSQSSYFLAWELGISLGLFLAFAFNDHPLVTQEGTFLLSYLLLVAGALAWFFLIYPWYKRHRHR